MNKFPQTLILLIATHLTLQDGCVIKIESAIFANATCGGNETTRLFDVDLKFNTEKKFASACQICVDYFTKDVIFSYDKLVTFPRLSALTNYENRDVIAYDNLTSNWEILRNQTLEFAENNNVNLEIYSGTVSETLRWQLVYVPNRLQAISFVTIDGLVDDFCIDISKNITWIDIDGQNETLGLSYVCTYDDLKEKIAFIPELLVEDIIRSKGCLTRAINFILLSSVIIFVLNY